MTDQTIEDEATPYHASVKEFRTTLVKAAAGFEKLSEELLQPIMRASEKTRETGDASHRDKVPGIVRDAHQASLMAFGYGYTLAAVIQFAEQHFGKATAHALACVADEILTNGDCDDLNGDITLEVSGG